MKRLPWRDSVEQEVESELAFHLEMTTRELMETGMTHNQARAEAERRFGDAKTIDAECRRFGHERDRNARRAEYRGELKQDIAFAVRQLLRAPAFSAIAVLTLALGIGATAAVFSVLDAVVLRPLPFEHSERIVTVNTTRTGEASSPTVPEYLGYARVKEFEHVAAAVLGSGVTMKLGEAPELFAGGRVTADYFAVFGVKPELGRTFTAAEDAPGQVHVAVMSHRLWKSRFNADPTVVGRAMTIDGLPHTIVGVMPASFDLTRGTEDVWLPLAITPDQATKFSERYLEVYARLRAGVTMQQARSAAVAAEREVAQRMPERSSALTEWGASLTLLMDEVVGDFRELLFILLGAVGFVLLIACGNVANLLLARGSVRAREMAIRAALGAGRGRLVRQLLTESLVLAIAGALLGLALAFALVKVIVAVSPEDVPRLELARVDWRVLLFTLGVSVASSVIFGLFPALRTAGSRLQGALREGGRGSAGGRDALRGILVAAEVALAITLLVGSGLLIRSAWLMQHVDPGFKPRGVMTARLMLPAARYPDGPAIVRLYESVRDEAARVPGVRSAALASVVPLSGSVMHSSVIAEGQPRDERAPLADLRLVSSGYFATMGIPLLAGRDIAMQDRAEAPAVVVINEALAKKLWPGMEPRSTIGKRFDGISSKRTEPHFMEVVGIVGNLHEASLSKPPEPAFYVPVAQTPALLWPILQRSLVVVARTANEHTAPETLIKPLRRAVTTVDASLPIADARSMESFLRASLQTSRMNTLLLSVLGGIALVLAMVGIYGVVSYFVSQRTQEIGLRAALGATPPLIWRFVVQRGLAPIVVGLVAGLVLSMLTTSVLQDQLYGVKPNDPLTLAAVAATLLLVALVATYVPARRAMRVPPIVALNAV